MTIPYPGCCCGDPVAGCGNTCFASSYSVSNLSGSYSLEKSWTLTEECICAGGDDPGVFWTLALDVTWTQPQAITFTRYAVSGGGKNGGCCYYGEGEVEVTCTFTLKQYLYDCATSRYLCTSDETFSRTMDVDCCLTAKCVSGTHSECVNSFNGTHWLVSLSICDFPVAGSVEFMTDDRPNRPPCILAPLGIVCGGAVVQWRAPLKAFPSIFRSEVGQRGLTPAAALCNQNMFETVEGATDCMQHVADNQATNGPFALYTVTEFSEQDEPALCSLDGTETTIYGAASMFGSGCDGYNWNSVPCWELECDDGCIAVTQSGGGLWPTIT